MDKSYTGSKLGRNTVNLLFTSVGRRVELLNAFKQAYQALELAGQIIATDIEPLAPALQVADKIYIVPKLNSPEYIPTIIRICQKEEIDLIFPLIDPDIPMLARNKTQLENTGARLAVIPEKSVEIANDKWLTYQFLKEKGLPTPKTWLPQELGDYDDLHFPLFIKPRQGSASANTFQIRNARELEFFIDYVPDPIIQEYLSGPEITNDVICDLDGNLLSVISRQRLQVRAGEVIRGVTIYNEEITEACKRIAAALPTIGPITVQCMMKDNMPYFTEINARLGGGAPISIAANADFPKWLLAKAAGIPLDIPPLGSYRTALYFSRFDQTFYTTGDKREQFANHRI